MPLFDGVDTTQLLSQAMRVAEVNHRVIAKNIANVDTPHFTPTRLDFQANLRAAIEGRDRFPLRRTDPRHIDVSHYTPKFEGLAFLSKNDYNKVDLDEEVAKLSENTGRYVLYGSLLTNRFQMIKNMFSNLR